MIIERLSDEKEVDLKKLVKDIRRAGYEMVRRVAKIQISKFDGELAEVGVSVGTVHKLYAENYS